MKSKSTALIGFILSTTVAGCIGISIDSKGDAPTAPTEVRKSSSLVVNTVTTAAKPADLDPVTYALSVDGLPYEAIGPNASLTKTLLQAGVHSISIRNVPDRCTLSGLADRQTIIGLDATQNITFTLNCKPVAL